jgi:hypothetical protein
MNTIYFDPPIDDAVRRKRLYGGQIIAYSPVPSAVAFCEFAREMLQQAFAPLDPRDAQYSMTPEEYAAILADLKPRFIHHPRSKEFIGGILRELGCDLEKVFFDVPRMRSATSDGYLTSGIAYAFHPHRDTWYSAPFSQINWWMPIYEVESENAMAFHPRYWSQPVRNGSREYDYYEWNATSRKNAAQHIRTDTRRQPNAEEPLELDPQIRIICPPGCLMLFSAAQMHSTVPNTSGRTRFSIDFRTVHIDDVIAQKGAPNIDSEPKGTTLRDFMRASNLVRISDDIIALYDRATPMTGELVFKPPAVSAGPAV